MPNTLLTPDMITREALLILHQKNIFLSNINKQYDNSFANEGAKRGSSLRIRLPNEYVVRTGATLSTQDTVETNTSITVSSQKGVDLSFTSVDLTMDIDKFKEIILDPAMSVLSARVEADTIEMFKDVYNQHSTGSALTYTDILSTRKKLVDNLTPMSAKSTSFMLSTQANLQLVDALKGLFNDQSIISKQFREGMLGSGQGMTYYESTHINLFTPGTNSGSGYLVNGGSQTGSTLVVDTGTGTLVKGDILTIAGVNRVHPETKEDTGELQQFVVTADYAGGAGSVSISPSIVTSGGRQNVTASPADNAAITKVGGSGSPYRVGIAHHRDAFAFASADLIKPNGTDMCSQQNYDGVSMRLVRDFDINNDAFPARFDVLYGFKTIRPQLACRLGST